MKRKAQDQRRQKRLGAALRVQLGRVSGVTRDVSASGVFFETDARYHKGSRIHFEINLDTPWGKAVCDCDGRIVRVERRDGAVGIAVQFNEAGPRARKAQARRRKPFGPLAAELGLVGGFSGARDLGERHGKHLRRARRAKTAG
jgi:hypothetical protein